MRASQSECVPGLGWGKLRKAVARASIMHMLSCRHGCVVELFRSIAHLCVAALLSQPCVFVRNTPGCVRVETIRVIEGGKLSSLTE